MKLERKKAFAARVLNVGKGRIVFNKDMLSEIKDAITRQDIIELYNSKAIFIREIRGRRAIVKRKLRRRAGSIRKIPKKGKQIYVRRARKFRAYIKELKKRGLLSKENYRKLRQEIRANIFKDKTHIRERIKLLK